MLNAHPENDPEPIYDPENEPTGRWPMSRTRKILLVIFVVGFWIFYFWYNTGNTPPKSESPAQTESPAPQKTPAEGERGIENEK